MAVQTNKTYILGSYELEPDKRRLWRDRMPVHLANRPFQVLVYLVENRHRVVTRDELFDRFWEGRDVYEDALRKSISAIRKALDESSEHPRFIETRWAEGYRYIGPFEERFSAESASLVEIEETRGLRVIIEEEIDDAKLKNEAVVAATAPAELGARPRPSRFGRRGILAAALILTALLAVVLIVYRMSRTPAAANVPAPIRSIAVLPLKNLTGDPNQDYFSDGLTESLISALAQIKSLKVISRTSVFSFKDKSEDARRIGQQLGVGSVLEGSLRRSGDSVRVEVRLVSTADGRVLWVGDSTNRALRDILAVEDEISCSVANELRAKLCGEDEPRRPSTTSVEAYQAYLKGRYFWEKRSPEGLKRAAEYFQQAISLDPQYALAYAGLSQYYASSIWFLPGVVEPREALRQARLTAAKAIELDEMLAEAHVAMADALANDWDLAGSLRHDERALALNPEHAEAHHHYAYALVLTGRTDEAVKEIQRALELDPLSVRMNVDVGEILLYARRYDEAIEALKHALEMDGERQNAHYDIGIAYEQKGMFEEAFGEYQREATLAAYPSPVVAEFAKAYAAMGMSGYWQKRREVQSDDARRHNVSPYYRGRFAARCGQTDAAFAWLEKAYAEHSPLLINLKADAPLDSLRGDPRFNDLLRRVGLPE